MPKVNFKNSVEEAVLINHEIVKNSVKEADVINQGIVKNPFEEVVKHEFSENLIEENVSLNQEKIRNSVQEVVMINEIIKNSFKEENLRVDNKIKLYKKRWSILLLYVFYMVCNSAQWLQFSIIPNATMRFYNVTNWQVDLTSLVFMICYVPLALPAAYFMNKSNIRTIAIIGSLLTALGSWVKVLSVSSDRFYLTLTGQVVIGVAQVLMLSVPQKLSSVWFGEKEVSSACSIGVFGFQLGIVIGFFLPPILVKNHDDVNLIGQEFYWMFIYFAIVSTFAALLVLIFFQAQPKFPPTISQAFQRSQKGTEAGYVRSLKRLFSKRHLTALFVTTGVNNGCFNGLSTLLSQIFLEYFPGQEEDAGRVGVTMVVFGMTSSVIFGCILDRTKKFKLILITIYYMSAIAMLTFTFMCYLKSVFIMYISAAFVGSFLCGFTAVSFDVATEVSFPESELITGTIMNMSSLFFTFIATVTFGFINQNFGYFWGNIAFAITLGLGATSTLPIDFPLKRTSAQMSKPKACEELELFSVKS